MTLIISTLIRSLRRRRLERAFRQYKASPGAKQSLAAARLLMKCGQGRKAVQVISDASRRFPEDRSVRRCYRKIKSRQALETLRRVERLVARDSSLRLLSKACDLASALADFDKAAHYAAEASRLYPDHWQSHLILGKLYFHRYNSTKDEYDRDQALGHLDRSYELEPDDYDTLLLLTLMLARTEDFEGAREVAHRLLATFPDDPRGIRLLGSIEQGLRASSRVSAPGTTGASEVRSAGRSSFALERLEEIEGAVGLFLFDDEGSTLERSIHDGDVFTFDETSEPVQAMLKTCRFDTPRIGIGELRSCLLYGEGWQALVRSSEGLHVVGFFEDYPHGEALEQEVEEALQEAHAG